MRRISIHRAFAKVRGVRRRLNALNAWAESFEGWLPEPDESFWHQKIPVLDRLVEPPTTTHGIQRQAVNALLLAATHLAESVQQAARPDCRAAVLLTLPYLFQSEVTLFFDRDYYQRFYYQKDLLPDAHKPSRRFGLVLPPGFVELGTRVDCEDETEDGQIVRFSEEWWTLGQAL